MLKVQEVLAVPVLFLIYGFESDGVADWRSQCPGSEPVDARRSMLGSAALAELEASVVDGADWPSGSVVCCRTIMEVCEQLADRNQGLLRLSAAAQEIMRVGLGWGGRAELPDSA